MNRRTLARDAAMSLWLSYRHLPFDDSTAFYRLPSSYEDFQYVKLGGPINF